MGTLRFTDLQTRPTEVLDLTSLTLDEFRQLVHLLKPRSRRIWPPGASMESRAPPGGTRPIRTAVADAGGSAVVYPGLFEDLPLQVVQGGCSEWARARPISGFTCSCVLRATLRALGDAPTRSLTELAKRLG